MRSRVSGSLAMINSARISLHTWSLCKAVNAEVRLWWSSGRVWLTSMDTTSSLDCRTSGSKAVFAWASSIQGPSHSTPSPAPSAVASPAGCARRLVTQRHSSAIRHEIMYSMPGKLYSFNVLKFNSRPLTLKTADSGPSPARTAARTASRALHKPFTWSRNSASMSTVSMALQMLSRFDGNTSPPSSTSPSDSFSMARRLNTSTFVLISAKILRTSWRERVSRAAPMFKTPFLHCSKR
mmetsp:Transcript_122431/g.351823  ORF Transcript_122431/g.351823 Transcript_122431/m.351823 type:complete len:238 (+) Transcript_122431:458-1171(+)